VRAAAQSIGRIELRYARFALAPDSALLWADAGTGIRRLRERIRRHTAVPDPSGPTGRIFAAVAFANVVRLAVAPDRTMVRAWRRLSPLDATDVVTSLDLVATDRYLSEDATELIARIELGSGDVVG
jgi:hypothetical protein